MLFDRIFEDALNFIRRFLWWQSRKTTTPEQKPFQSMRSHTGDWGVINLVVGRDTPRAVRTWIYSPRRQSSSEALRKVNAAPQDLHFYLDFLGPLPQVETPMAVQEREERKARRRNGEPVYTHRIHILRASHFLNTNGFYDCELIFWADYDFHLMGALDAQRIAILVLDKLMSSCLRMTDPLSLAEQDWAQAIATIWQDIREGGASQLKYQVSRAQGRSQR